MQMPRLMPLVAVAAVGVLAINAVENGPGILGAARSFAEGVAHKAAKGSGGADYSAVPADANVAAPAPSDQVVADKPAPICAESPAQLAKDAGLSPAELQVIQSLGARRGELDQREQGLDTELALIQAAEAKVDAKIVTMNALKADMQGLVGQLDAKQQAEVDSLVKVYAAMKPQAAADRFVLLSDQVRLPIAAAMKERVLSAIMADMPAPDAKTLTEALAARYVAQVAAARQAINPPPAQAQGAPPPATTPPATTPPAKPGLAQANPPTTGDQTPAPAKPKAKRKLAQHKPAKPKTTATADAGPPPTKPVAPVAPAAPLAATPKPKGNPQAAVTGGGPPAAKTGGPPPTTSG